MSFLRKPAVRYAASGAAAGLINGLFGAGGGMILIPLLIHWGKLEDKQAFSSSIFIILPICLVSLFIYSRQQVISFPTALPYLLGGLLGGMVGGFLIHRISSPVLHRIFGLFILWGGIRLLW